MLTTEQVKLLVSEVSPRGRLAMALAAYAGLRAGEVRGLKWTDVDLHRGVLVVRSAICRGVEGTPKSGDQRIVPLAKPLRALLRKTKPVSERVATTRGGGIWAEHSLLRMFKRACVRAKLASFRFHDLRHYFVTHLFRSGTPAPTVQALAGHGSLVVTQRYAHVARCDLRTAVVTAW